MTIINKDRQFLKTNRMFWPLIKQYSKFEWALLRFIYIWITSTAIIGAFVLPFIGMNKKGLIFDFYVPFVSFESISLTWWVNFTYQSMISVITAIVLNSHFGVTVLVISHACFKVDAAAVAVKRLGHSFGGRRMKVEFWRIFNHSVIRSRMIRFVEESSNLFEYMDLARSYISLPNCADTIVLSFAIVTGIFAGKQNWFNSFVCILIALVALSQLFSYNAAGQMVLNKLEKLESSAYATPWHNLNVSDQRKISFILQAMQQLSGFKGVFYSLSYATFYAVS